MEHTSILVNTPCELINITPMNPLISRCQIKVCYIGKNRNGSEISKEVAREMANTLPGSPIVGFYREESQDFEEHNRRFEIVGGVLKVEDTTRPYGFVDLNPRVWFQDYLDDGVVHTYLVTEGYLWTGQYPEAKRIIEHGNNQSMELDENSLDGSWTFDDNSGMEFFIINEAVISKLCILGEDFEPCFEGASIGKFSLDKDFNQRIYSLMKEVRNLKGGELSMVDEKLKELETEEEVTTEFAAAASEEVTEETVEETNDEEVVEATEEGAAQEETETEETIEEEKIEDNLGESIQFSLDDFQKLQERYSSLEKQYNDLNDKYDELTNECNSLREFKNVKDREAKQAMIDSFYMLSDEEKADVQNNIDNYSIDDIEAKLSVICVHNKLNLSDDNKETEEKVDTTFSLDDTNNEQEENIPGWVSLLRKNKTR